MSQWRRRIRGAIGMGLTWAAAWFGAGMVLLLILGPDAADVPFPLFFGLLGFLAGLAFSAVVGMVARRRRFDQLSLPRFALWGAAGGLLFSVPFVLVAGLIAEWSFLGPLFAAAGAACASLTLAMARRARDRTALEAGETRARLGGNG